MSFTLAYSPYSVVLKNPKIPDNLEIDLQTKFQANMNGDTYSYKYSNVKNRFTYDFEDMPNTELDALLNFIQYQGLYDLTITDHNGVSYTGRLLTETLEYTETGVVKIPGSGCPKVFYSVSFQVEKN